MKTQVEFRSDKFPPYEGEEEQINPNRWGKRLAEYLERELNARGIETGRLVPEDWGWWLRVKSHGFSMWIGCGNYEEYPNGYLCFVEPSKPVVWRLFRRIDTTEQVGRVTEALNQILASDPEIHGVRWWSEDEK
jgi:hypothetical protein